MQLLPKYTATAGWILTKTGSRAQIVIFGYLRKVISDQAENSQWHTGRPVGWTSGGSPRVETSIYAVGYREAFTVSTHRVC